MIDEDSEQELTDLVFFLAEWFTEPGTASLSGSALMPDDSTVHDYVVRLADKLAR